MSGHTPGPWAVRNGREVFKGQRRVCSVNAAESLSLEEEMERAKNNARLIAAAPELLDLLMESQNSIGGDWRQRRDAVIAKARGE